jgi:hypothetical protein
MEDRRDIISFYLHNKEGNEEEILELTQVILNESDLLIKKLEFAQYDNILDCQKEIFINMENLSSLVTIFTDYKNHDYMYEIICNNISKLIELFQNCQT